MSADMLDDADELAQAERDRRIGEIRRQADRDALAARNAPLPTECQNGCGAIPAERSRWCSPDCREDEERRKGIERRAGLRK